MSFKSVFHLVGYMTVFLALFLGLSWGVGALYGDPAPAQRALVISAVINLCAGAGMLVLTRGAKDLKRADGFGIVAFGWVVASCLGALPYVLSGVISHPVSAVFETMSGFTTTGSSVLSNLEQVPRGILFWRATTHFLGGMGVLVLCVAILPFLRVGGMQIYRAEIPGPSKDRLTPRIASTAKLLWGMYIGFCVLETLLLWLGGMDVFDAVCHSFATMATGGFSTRSASIAAYPSAYIQVVIIVFMFLAGANFALHFRALRGDLRCFYRDPEFRFYFVVWLGACLFLSLNVWGRDYPSFGHSMLAGFFQGTSIMTTTGFCTEDFNLWSNAARMLLVLLMFVGGCAGSTGGGMKNIRVFVILKKVVRELQRFLNPSAVVRIKLGGKPLDQSIVSHISAFVAMFVLAFAVGTFIMTFYTPDLETAFSSVIASLGNIGPGLNKVGAVETYAAIPAPGKAFLTFCMLLGRLELYTIMILFIPRFWRR